MTVNIELRKGARRGTQVIIADGAEVGSVHYQSQGSRAPLYTFYHPAPRHGAVILPNSPQQGHGGNRRPVSVTDQDAIIGMARQLVEGGHLKPVAHWQKLAAEARAKLDAREKAERARERVARAGPALLKALKDCEETMDAILSDLIVSRDDDLIALRESRTKALAAIKQAEED